MSCIEIRGMNNPKKTLILNSRPSSTMSFTTIHDDEEDDDIDDENTLVLIHDTLFIFNSKITHHTTLSIFTICLSR